MDREKALSIFAKIQDFSDNFILAGSVARGKTDDIHDLDTIYIGNEIPLIPCAVLKKDGDDVKQFIIDNEQVDVYRTTPESLGAMLCYLIGSKRFNIKMRAVAKKKGLLLNQKGLFDQNGNLIASEIEREIFDTLGMEWVEYKDRNI